MRLRAISVVLSSLGRSSFKMYVLFSTACLSRRMLHCTLTPSGAGLHNIMASHNNSVRSLSHECLEVVEEERCLCVDDAKQAQEWCNLTSFGLTVGAGTSGTAGWAGPGATSKRVPCDGSYTVSMPAHVMVLEHNVKLVMTNLLQLELQRILYEI